MFDPERPRTLLGLAFCVAYSHCQSQGFLLPCLRRSGGFDFLRPSPHRIAYSISLRTVQYIHALREERNEKMRAMLVLLHGEPLSYANQSKDRVHASILSCLPNITRIQFLISMKVLLTWLWCCRTTYHDRSTAHLPCPSSAVARISCLLLLLLPCEVPAARPRARERRASSVETSQPDH